jgi:hypothetical protein
VVILNIILFKRNVKENETDITPSSREKARKINKT